MMDNHTATDAPMSPARMQVRFGPRTVEVERFLLLLSKLPLTSWLQAGATFDALSRAGGARNGSAPDAAGGLTWAEAERMLMSEMDQLPSARNRVSRRVVTIASATKGIVHRGAYDSLLRAALTGVFAIICRDQLGPEAFHLLYSPFAELIPVEELETPAA